MRHSMNNYPNDMLNWINAVSLALQDTVLFLDTHPDNSKALAYFDECSKMRNEALAEYAKKYGPILIDDVTMSDVDYWNWINQPWPWEEGGL